MKKQLIINKREKERKRESNYSTRECEEHEENKIK